MALLTMRLYRNTTDLQSIVDLLTACEKVDQEDKFYSTRRLEIGFAEPSFNPYQNVGLWEDAAGRLIGFAELWMPTEPVETFDGFLWFRVHPEQRWQGIEANILRWAEARIQKAAAEQSLNLPIKLFGNCRTDQIERVAFYEQQGFEYERCFLTMTRSLTEPIVQPVLPEGFQIIQTAGAEDAEKWVEMYNQTFIDHWGFHPHTVEDHCYWLTTPTYCPNLDLVAVAPDGTFAALCYGHIDTEANQQKQRQDGWINSLGTRRGFRRMGLARAMLLSGLQRLQAAGMQIAKLGVDTANPNSAESLYRSVGFRKLYARLTYSKSIGRSKSGAKYS